MSDRAVHFAIFKWKEGAPIAEIEAIFEEQKQKICATITGIQSFEWGMNQSPFGKGYTHALTVIADDLKAINAYRNSELRVKTKSVINVWREHDISADFGKA